MVSDKLKRGPHNLFVSYAKGEVDFRKKHFKDVEALYSFKDEWKCTMCLCNLEDSILKGKFCKHPALGVLVCHKCLEYYGDGLFSPDEEGEDKFCRWCAQGGDLYCCSKCVCTFCKKCVRRHFKDNEKVLKCLKSADWQCFLCESKPIWFLRALCWAVYHFKNEFLNKGRLGKRSRRVSVSSSEEEEKNRKKNKSSSKIESGPRSKREGETSKKVDSEEESDSDNSAFEKKKTEKSKRNGKVRKCKETEVSEDEEEVKPKGEVLGPRSRRKKQNASSSKDKYASKVSDDECSEEETRKKPMGAKSKQGTKKESKESSDEEEKAQRLIGSRSMRNSKNSSARRSRSQSSSAEENEDSDNLRKKTRPGPKSKTEKQRETRSRLKEKVSKETSDENEECSSDEKPAKKAKVGPKSRVNKSSDKSSTKKAIGSDEDDESSSDEKPAKKAKVGPKSRVNKSSDKSSTKKEIGSDEDNESLSDEKSPKKAKVGPKSRVNKSSDKSSTKKAIRSDEDDESSSDEKSSKKAKVGPMPRVNKSSDKSSTKKEIGSDENDESSSDEKSSKKTKIGPKSRINKYSNKSSTKEKMGSNEDEEGSPDEKAFKKTKVGPKSRVNKSSDKSSTKKKINSDEDDERSSDEKSKKIKMGPKTLINKSTDKSGTKEEMGSDKEPNDQSRLKDNGDSAEKALNIFTDSLDLCENLTQDIHKKVAKLKKLSNMSKFTSARNTKKILTLLSEEMKRNSELFSYLVEVVDNHIGCVDAIFDDAMNTIYDESTMSSSRMKEQASEDSDVNTGARDKKRKTSSEKKPKENPKDANDVEDSEKTVDEIRSILTSDEDDDVRTKITGSKSDIKSKKSTTRSQDLEKILTSDSDEAKTEVNDSKMDFDEPEETPVKAGSTENVGVEDILKSDEDMSVDDNEAAKESILSSEDEEAVESTKTTTSKSDKENKSAKKKINGDADDKVTIKNILHSSSDSDDNAKGSKKEEIDSSKGVTLEQLLSSDSDNNEQRSDESKVEEDVYYSLKSESELENSKTKESTKKGTRRNSCKDDSEKGEKSDHSDDEDKSDENDSSKNKSKSKGNNVSKGKEKKDEKTKETNSKKDSISQLTGLSSLDKTPNSKNKSRSERSKTETPNKKTLTRKKSKEPYKEESLLGFLNEDECSSAEDLEESTELLSSLIKAKGEEAKKQNEEMIKQGLLRADDESNKEESDSEQESNDDIGVNVEKATKSKVKSEQKIKHEKSESEDEKEKKKSKRESWRNDRLLTEKLTDTDTDEGEAKMKRKKEAQDTITLSSDEDPASKRKTKKSKESSDDSDCFVIKKKMTKKRRARLRDSSDSSDCQVITSSEESQASSDSDFKKKKDKGKKKRSRIKKMKDSDDSDEDSGEREVNTSQGTPGKGRKNIRHILTNEELTLKTITASKAEEDRKRRIEERQALYNKLFKLPDNADEKLTKLVLDFDEKTKTELISVHPDLVCKLKPHQVQGVRFMFNACFESAQQIKKNKAGSGCILAHCMGLGKTLQVVTLVHTLMTHQDLTKVNRVMIVTPLNTVSNWVDEFHNWLKKINNGDDVETYNLIKSKKDYDRSYHLNSWFEEGGVLIIGYEMFRNLINKQGLSKKVKTTVRKTLLDPGPDLVVCDEGHILKNEASAISKAMCQIKTLRRIILTGTPLQNNLEEYHCMVQFVKPNLLGDRKEFKNRFAHPINNGQYIDSTPRDVKIMKRRAHVLYKMLDGIVQRRDYNVLTPFLPPKYEYVISIKLTDLQIKLYSHYLESQVNQASEKPRLFADYQALKLVWTHPWTLKSASLSKQKRDDAKMSDDDSEGSLRDFIDDGDDDDDEEDSSEGSNPPPRKKRTRAATKMAIENGEIIDEEDKVDEQKSPSFWWTSLVSDEDIENIANSNKLLAFMFVLKECEEIGDKLLVFSQSLETLSLLEYFLNKIDECTQDGTLDQNLSQFQASWTLGVDYFRLDGSSSSEDRSYWVKSFNNPTNLRARLFLISTKAGGLGINLVAANRVIIFDVSWNPSHDIQSIFRVFRFGQTKPCYIYRFLAQGTMEEKIYDRQVAKQSMSCRVVDEQQIDRHFTRSDISELYEFKPDERKDRKTPALPKDRLMAEMIKKMESKIVTFHEHDSLLENVQDEELNEEERKAAWEEYESEKSRPAMSAGMSYVNNLIANSLRQKATNGVLAPEASANLKVDNQHMLNFLKQSNPDVSEAALQKIVDQNVQRLAEYKKRQEVQFQSMINNMRQGMQQSYANQMMNNNLTGGIHTMNRMPMFSAGMPFPRPGVGMHMPRPAMTMPRPGVSSARGGMVPKPIILKQGKAVTSETMQRMNPVATSTPRPPRPRDGSGGTSGPGSSTTPIEI